MNHLNNTINILHNKDELSKKDAVDILIEKEDKEIKEMKLTYEEEKRWIHKQVKDNLQYFRKLMKEHQEFEKEYKQSPWRTGTCGYCSKDRQGKNWMYFGDAKREMLEIICSKCLFTDKIWKA